MIKAIHRAAAAAPKASGPAPSVVAKNAFFKLYQANQSSTLSRRPGWPDVKGAQQKLTGGAVLQGLGGVQHLPKGSKAAHAVNAVIKAGVDGDQGAYQLKVGGTTYLAVAVFPEDASRDQVWLWDATGQHRVAHGEPNENTGKLEWK